MKRLFVVLFAVACVVAASFGARAQTTVVPGSQLPLASPSPSDILFGIKGGTLGVGGTTSRFTVGSVGQSVAQTMTVVANQATVARTLPALFGDVLHAKDFGVQCNGTADDTANLQAAITAAAGNARLYVDQTGNNCVISSTLVVPSNSQVFFDANLFLANGAETNMVSVGTATSAASNVVIGGTGTFQGNNSNQGTCPSGCGGVYVYTGASHVWITQLSFNNIYNWPVNVVGSSYVYLSYLTTTNTGPHGNTMEFASATNNCWADHLNVSGGQGGALVFYGGVYNCGVSNSIGSSNWGSFGVDDDYIVPAASHDIIIANNIATGSTTANCGIGVTVGSGGNTPYAISVIGNDVTNNYDYGICVTANHSLVANNIVHNDVGPTGIGIRVYGGSYADVINNQIYDEGEGYTNATGISLQNSTTQSYLSGNHIYDDQGAGATMNYGLNGTLGAGSYVANNFCTGMIVACNNLTLASDTYEAQYDGTNLDLNQPLVLPSTVPIKFSASGTQQEIVQYGTGLRIGTNASNTGPVDFFTNGMNNSATAIFDTVGGLTLTGALTLPTAAPINFAPSTAQPQWQMSETSSSNLQAGPQATASANFDLYTNGLSNGRTFRVTPAGMVSASGQFFGYSGSEANQSYGSIFYTQSGGSTGAGQKAIFYSCTFAAGTTCAVSFTGTGNSFTAQTSMYCPAPDMGTGTTYVGFTVGNKTTTSLTVYASGSNSDTVYGACFGY